MLIFDTEYAYKQQGFILITVLFFLSVMALMVLVLLDTVHLTLKMSRNDAMTSQQFQVAEAGLKIAEEQLVVLAERNKCVFYGKRNNAGYPLSYDIRRLSVPFCIDQKIAYYYLITAKAEQIEGNPLILQITTAKKGNDVCRGKEINLEREGRSSWRELSQF